MTWLHHLYSAMWSNMWAPSIPTMATVVVAHLRAAAHRERLHEQMHEQAERLAARGPDGAP